jgi:ubiquinone/menaquinone biosynthesis C-methylase UbiE
VTVAAMSGIVALDWGSVGRYEDVAVALEPIARAVVDRADIAPGERVLDIGSGTGNAALLAAERGGRVIGIDTSPRLINIARKRAEAKALKVDFEVCDAARLPFEDGAFDIILDALSLAFIGDRAGVLAELARVTAPGGRIVWSAWLPNGANFEAVKARGLAAQELGRAASKYAASGLPSSEWHDAEALRPLFAAHGFTIGIEQNKLRYTAPSARDFYLGMAAAHPALIVGDDFFRAHNMLDSVNARAIAIFEDMNEEPPGFAVSPGYIVGIAHRRSSA